MGIFGRGLRLGNVALKPCPDQFALRNGWTCIGIGLILFGVVLALFVELGPTSAPMSINLFLIQRIWGGKLSDVTLDTISFHLTMFVLLIPIILWLA
jgi:TRAP-type C4-dicarboxylate transport system permease large subunit